jgi:hypothetical protein
MFHLEMALNSPSDLNSSPKDRLDNYSSSITYFSKSLQIYSHDLVEYLIFPDQSAGAIRNNLLYQRVQTQHRFGVALCFDLSHHLFADISQANITGNLVKGLTMLDESIATLQRLLLPAGCQVKENHFDLLDMITERMKCFDQLVAFHPDTIIRHRLQDNQDYLASVRDIRVCLMFSQSTSNVADEMQRLFLSRLNELLQNQSFNLLKKTDHSKTPDAAMVKKLKRVKKKPKSNTHY